MKRWTWSEVLEEIQSETDLFEEDFANEKDLMAWFNRAIDKVESRVHRLSRDYFLTKVTLPVVAGQSSYALPSDIYGGMIRKVIFDDARECYNINRIKRLEDIPLQSETTQFQFEYLILNNIDDEPRLTLYPTPKTNYPTEVTIYYIRNAKRLEYNATDRAGQEIDIPEWTPVCTQYVIAKIHEKEDAWQKYSIANTEYKEMLQEMTAVLSQRERDGEVDKIIPDFESYEEQI